MYNLNFTGFMAHQGDTQFFQVKGVPQGAKKVEKQFIAASERSGSFHALFGEYDMYEVEEGYIVDCKEDCLLNHSLQTELAAINNDLSQVKVLPKKDHRHTVIPKGIHYTGVQHRFDPLSAQRMRTRD